MVVVEMGNSLRTFLDRSVRAPHTTIMNLKTSWRTTYERRENLEHWGNSKRSLATALLLEKLSTLNTTLKEELKEKTTSRKNRLNGPIKITLQQDSQNVIRLTHAFLTRGYCGPGGN